MIIEPFDPENGPPPAFTYEGPENVAEGDINSHAKGSAARMNAGKPALELIPIRLWRVWWAAEFGLSHDHPALDSLLADLQMWQEGEDEALHDAFRVFPFDARTDVVSVLEFGANKYKAWNWAKGQRWGCTLGSLLRHCRKILQGEVKDTDSHLPHWGHIGANLMFLVWFADNYPEGDDRPPMFK